MTVLFLADAREAADLAAFLARLIHYDRRAVVRVQTGGGVFAVFGRPAPFEVLAIRTARLAGESDAPAAPVDGTVSAGQLADAIDTATGAAGPADDAGTFSADTLGANASGDAVPEGVPVRLPQTVTGPAWAGMLPPRGGWRRLDGLPEPETLREVVAAAVTEFRARIAGLPEARRTRPELDAVGREIWSRTLGGTRLPLRAAHAAQSLGFLRPVRIPVRAASPAGGGGTRTSERGPVEPLALLAAGPWLRLRTPYGSIAVRASGLPGLTVTPA